MNHDCFRRRIVCRPQVNKGDLNTVGDFMAAGKLTPVIDKRYPLTEASEAFRYMGKGMLGGKYSSVWTVTAKRKQNDEEAPLACSRNRPLAPDGYPQAIHLSINLPDRSSEPSRWRASKSTVAID
jgi:Zinc-binding dehydrogenase